MINMISGIKSAGRNDRFGMLVTRYPTGRTQPAASSSMKITVIKIPPKPIPNQKSFHQPEVILKPKSENGRRSKKWPANQTLKDKNNPLTKKVINNVCGDEPPSSPEGFVKESSLNIKESAKERISSLITNRMTNNKP